MTQEAAIVCISGVDGSGKSMLVEALREHAELRGKRVEVRWLRFNHYYTRPLLMLCGVLGLTHYEVIEGQRIGKHNFGKPRLLAKLFIFLQFLDAKRAVGRFLSRAQLQRFDLLILDRFALDILADICVATDDPAFPSTPMASRIEALLPRRALQLGVQRPEAATLACRPESAVDPSFVVRQRAYRELFERPGVHVLKNEGSQEELVAQALRLMGE